MRKDAEIPRPEHTIEEVLCRWPATARVFLHRRMACIGCVMAPFQTVQAAARSYQVAEAELLAELRAAATAPSPEKGA